MNDLHLLRGPRGAGGGLALPALGHSAVLFGLTATLVHSDILPRQLDKLVVLVRPDTPARRQELVDLPVLPQQTKLHPLDVLL